MEASAIHAPAVARRGLSAPLLRLRSDEQLVSLFRAGSEDAFAAIHDRYRQRLFAYVRQMLSSQSRADAEDVLQDVFVRAYGALRADDRELSLRAWLYRVAHNRCIDQLRRPTPAAGDVFDMSRTPLLDPIETAQRREDLRRLVDDVGRLPEQQRSALLMREIDGMAYAHISEALGVTVPAVKSLLVRARIGLVEAIEARDTQCSLIREDLLSAYDRGVKASGRARKHMRECAGCRDYRGSLRGMQRSFAALSPVGAAGPIALVAKSLGLGGASGGAAAGGGAAVGGGAGVAAACKVAAVVCTAVVATGGAVEVQHLRHSGSAKPPASEPSKRAAQASASSSVRAAAPVAVSADTIRRRTGTATAAPSERKSAKQRAAHRDKPAVTVLSPTETPPDTVDQVVADTAGGALAPAEEIVVATPEPTQPSSEDPSSPSDDVASPPQDPQAASDPAATGGSEPSDGPPTQH